MASKDKKLYNYVVNTLGLSKETVLNYINQRLEELVTDILNRQLDSGRFEEMLLNRLTLIIENGFKGGRFGTERLAFQDLIRKQLRAIIEEKLNQDFDLQIHALIKKHPNEKGAETLVRRPFENLPE